MACNNNLTKGRKKACFPAIGGVQAAYFFNKGDITVAYDAIDTDVVDDLGTGSCYKYDIRSASNLIQTQTSTDLAMSVSQIITLVLGTLDASTNYQIKLMGMGNPHVVIHFKNGEAVIVGIEFGAILTTATADSGTAIGDGTFYTLTLTGEERTLANFLEGSTAADPFAGLTSQPVIVEGV